MYNIVTNQKIINLFKKSRYFKQSLGMVATIEKNGDRVYNDRDKFSFFYNNQYKTTIYCQGSVGNIMFYLDYYIREDILGVYVNTEEFVFKFDESLYNDRGSDFYLGHILKELETKHEERVKQAAESKIQVKKDGDPSKLTVNPGAVSYDDIKAYLKKKNEERYSVGGDNQK